jgi:hypothetical protein
LTLKMLWKVPTYLNIEWHFKNWRKIGFLM